MSCVTPSTIGFSAQPTYTDAKDDQSNLGCYFEDIWYVWLSCNTTYLQCKIEFNGTWIYPDSWLWIYVSVNDLTGSNDSSQVDINADYCIWMENNALLYFEDFNDGTPTHLGGGTNDINTDLNGTGFAYSLFSNNNCTLEIGYKFQSNITTGEGYFNVSMGDTMKIKFKSDTDCDYAPDLGQDPITFTLSLPGTNPPPIPAFELLLVLIPIACLALYVHEKKKNAQPSFI